MAPPCWRSRRRARAAQRRAGDSAFRKRSARAAHAYVGSALRLARRSRLRTYVRACTTRRLRCAW